MLTFVQLRRETAVEQDGLLRAGRQCGPEQDHRDQEARDLDAQQVHEKMKKRPRGMEKCELSEAKAAHAEKT